MLKFAVLVLNNKGKRTITTISPFIGLQPSTLVFAWYNFFP